MSERYTRIFALSESLYTENSPVVIMARALLKDNVTGEMIAQLKFKSTSNKTIKALKVTVRAFDVSGTEIEGVPEFQYLDLSVNRDSEFGQKNAIVLPSATTRSFECECTQVIFSDNTKWESLGSKWTPLSKLQPLSEKLGTLSEQYRIDTTKKAKYVVTDDRDLWLCTCGEINHSDEEICFACGCKKIMLINALNVEKLQEHMEAREQEIERALEEKKEAQAKLIANVKKYAPYVGGTFAVVVILIILVVHVFIPNSKYNDAIELMNENKFVEAISAFEKMDGYKDSEEQIKRSKYLYALELLNAKSYPDAQMIFESLGDYDDSEEQVKECIYCQFFELASTTEFEDLSSYYANTQNEYELLDSIRGYRNVDELLANYHRVLISKRDDSGKIYYAYDCGKLIYDGEYLYTYDSDGRVIEEESIRGSTYSLKYNDKGLLVSRTGPYGTTTYSYNKDNQLIKAKSDSSSTSYSYNEAGQLVEEVLSYTYLGDSYKVKVTTVYTYDSDGRVKTKTRKSNLNRDETVTRYYYNKNGELVQEIEVDSSYVEEETIYEYGWILY